MNVESAFESLQVVYVEALILGIEVRHLIRLQILTLDTDDGVLNRVFLRYVPLDGSGSREQVVHGVLVLRALLSARLWLVLKRYNGRML